MLSLLCPTRGRPDRFADMCASVLATVSDPSNVEILAYLQADDDRHRQYKDTTGLVKFIKGPHILLSDMWNQLIPHAQGEIFQQTADDVLYRTPNWDREIEKAFEEYPDRIVLVFADDRSKRWRGKFACLPFVHRRWVEAVGYFTGPGFWSWFSDGWPNDLADMIGRKKYLPYVVIEHMHFLDKKSQMDNTYREGLSTYRKTDKKRIAAFKAYDARLPERLADADKLRAVMIP